MAKPPVAVRQLQDPLSTIPAMDEKRCLRSDTPGTSRRPCGTWRSKATRGLRRRDLRGREKGGPCVGPTKRGKGSKLMAVVDGNGLPLRFTVNSSSPSENKLLEEVLEVAPEGLLPEKLIGDRAYDDDRLDERVLDTFDIELIAPNRRKRRLTQDGRLLRRYRRRWKVERLFAWLGNFRRLVVRWEKHVDNFMGFVSLACALILLRRL